MEEPEPIRMVNIQTPDSLNRQRLTSPLCPSLNNNLMTSSQLNFKQNSKRISQNTSAVNNTRLIIDRIELENFKSYGGHHIIGPLHASFTAVVGPNGSGKSNVIEAILFVFGRRANKLRQSKLADLIHKSAAYPNCTYAKVSVHFKILSLQPQEKVDNHETLVISRIAYPDRSAEYQIDNVKASVEQINHLLKDQHGVDLENNRFLILQGEVENISMMDRLSLLNYLEEIIGTNIYLEPIESATAQLSLLSDEYLRKSECLRIAERERDVLESEKNQAQKCLTKMKDLCDRKAQVYAYQKFLASKDLDKYQQLTDEMEQKLHLERQQLTQLNDQLASLVSHLEAQTERQRHTAHLDSLKNELKQLEELDLKLRDQYKRLHEDKLSWNKKASINSEQLATKTAEISKFRLQAEKLAKAIQEEDHLYEVKNNELNALQSKMNQECAPLAQRLASRQRDLIPLQKARIALETCRTAQLLDREALLNNVEKTSSAWQEMKNYEKERSVMLLQLQKRSKEVHALNQKLDHQLVQLNERRMVSRMKDRQLSEKVIDCRQKLEDRVKSSDYINQLLKKLFHYYTREEKQDLTYQKSVLGRLGDLATVDSRYDIAVSTASSAWNHIVVTTSDIAQKCVQILRQHRIGRATFLVLSEIQHWAKKDQSRIEAPKDTTYVIDHLRLTSDQVRSAFIFALRDTLCCEDLQKARDVALESRTKRRRVVTLQGDLFEPHGTLTGGGRQPFSGLVRLHSSTDHQVKSDQIRKSETKAALAIQLNGYEQELKQVRDELVHLDREHDSLTILVDQAQQEHQLLMVKLGHLEAQVSDEIQSIERLEIAMKEAKMNLDQKIPEIDCGLSSMDQVLLHSSDSTQSLEAEIAAIREELDQHAGSYMKQLEIECHALSKQLNKRREEVIETEVTLESAEKAVRKAQTVSTTCRTRLESIQVDQEDVMKQLDALTDQALALNQSLSLVEQELAKVMAQLQQEQQAVDELKRETTDQLASVRDIENKLKLTQVEYHEVEVTIQTFEKKLRVTSAKKLDLRVDEDDTDFSLVLPGEDEMNQWGDEQLKNTTLEINRLHEEIDESHFRREAILCYREKAKKYEEQHQDVQAVRECWEIGRQELDALHKHRLEEFMEGYCIINTCLQEMYRMITNQSGNAELECSTDPFSEGVSFSVRPPNKTWKNIQNLSGGEKTLSSLALVFALHRFKPTPIYIMDEIDAALDFRNVSIIANYIKEKTKNAQFLVISLRNYMFELADRLIGIYKIENVTKTVIINPASFKLAQK